MKRILPLLLLLSACGQPPLPSTPPAPGPPAGLDAYRAAAAAGSAVYAVDPRASLLAVSVRRAGMMARLGHDHVVASRTLEGYAAPALRRADLSFRIDRMSIDERQLLREAHIATQPSPQAVEGTRKNMLGPVLDAVRYPVVTIHAEMANGPFLRIAVALHGVTRQLELPATVQAGAAQLTASGTARVKQSEFGITPFSAGGGLLAVDDELEVRYRIVARRWEPPRP